MTKAIFLDRDGVINELVYYPDYDEDESPRIPDHLRLMPGTLPALQMIQLAGWLLFIVSNQPSYAKGKCSLEDLKRVADSVNQKLVTAGITITASYYSYTHPNGIIPEYTTESVYRKPNNGFLLEAARDYGVDLNTSWMIGDRDTDIACGQRSGTHTALIRYPRSLHKQGSTQPDLICNNLVDFAYQLTQGS